jgi:hypothetical protein
MVRSSDVISSGCHAHKRRKLVMEVDSDRCLLSSKSCLLPATHMRGKPRWSDQASPLARHFGSTNPFHSRGVLTAFLLRRIW